MTATKPKAVAMREEDPDFLIIRHENRGRAIDIAFWLEGDVVDASEEIKKFLESRRDKRRVTKR